MEYKKLYKYKNVIYWLIFIAYAIINLILMLRHEPWRDEIHPWLMAKDLSIVDLFIESRFDGHPILWHLLLMPFAKLNFPIITLNIISYVMLLISAWLFLFKTKVPILVKLFAIFTIPFTYTYSAISRNYSCIILLLVIIGVFYPKKEKYPILYSILICLLIHTHSLAWGIVAGLTITFHFYEIFLYLKNKKHSTNIKSIIIGLALIVLNTLLVVFELYGNTNINYFCTPNKFINKILLSGAILLLLLLIYTIFILKSHFKEFIILAFGFTFQAFIYKFVYSSILYQRYILFFVLILFYLILVSHSDNINNIKYYILSAAFLIITIFTGFDMFYDMVTSDFSKPFSAAQEMANYINNNVPKDSTILIDASIIEQSLVPYIDDSYSLYDIAYNQYIGCANVAYDDIMISDAFSNLDFYHDKYLIVCNNNPNDYYDNLSSYEKLYETSKSMMVEYFTLYFLP